MSRIISELLDEKIVRSQHLEKNALIESSLQKDFFDPTDLLLSSLCGCVLLTMSIMAQKDKEVLSGTKIEGQKEFIENPRRIGRISLKVSFRDGLDEAKKERYLKAAQACPVKNSLHPDILIIIEMS